jgi:hypothetical protein
MGLIYHNPRLPAYEDLRNSRAPRPDHETFLKRLNGVMDRYAV